MLHTDCFDVVVIGGGAAGIGVTASLLRRQPGLRIAIVEPNDHHYYQPAWTLVGGGAFEIEETARPMASVIPRGAKWIRAAARTFLPIDKRVQLNNGLMLKYQQLIVCPGLRMAWEKIDGLQETLGCNGVTSNYRFDLAPYTWELVRNLRWGKALFTQPNMPIKCAGAPQKALYLACHHWRHRSAYGVPGHIDVEMNLAGSTLFGIPAFVPALAQYMEKYEVDLTFQSNLVAVDGRARVACFEVTDRDGRVRCVTKRFDMLHVVPPQAAPDVIRISPLADQNGWCEVNPHTLQNPHFADVFSLGDVANTPNAKTAAAVRKQVVVVAENLLALREGRPLVTFYDGYGACPLTVERGKVILAEFGYGGKLLPSFPLDPVVPRSSAWLLKTRVLPWVYWNCLLKGREWWLVS
ncbi:NAD(P)/FAD-dependent oxidoreductase [Pseudomonas fluorescens]|nr:NAD(P)/FAD-dependent oxidoreductase [Pseudomonas fluorescens]